jgi:hypothetical protein
MLAGIDRVMKDDDVAAADEIRRQSREPSVGSIDEEGMRKGCAIKVRMKSATTTMFSSD